MGFLSRVGFYDYLRGEGVYRFVPESLSLHQTICRPGLEKTPKIPPYISKKNCEPEYPVLHTADPKIVNIVIYLILDSTSAYKPHL